MIDRRKFTAGLGAGLASIVMPPVIGSAGAKNAYTGPNVIIVRFGGGVRRRETIDTEYTYAPYLRNVLAPRGVLIPNMMIDRLQGVDTSHAEGTLNILTGRYLGYSDAGSRFLQDRLAPTHPTLFEYLRSAFDIPSHQALLINGEDRPQEEFFTYGSSRHYGIAYRSEMLSLHRFKLYLYDRILEEGRSGEEELALVRRQREELLAADSRDIAPGQSPAVERFWTRWRQHYGDSGLVNSRGDRLLTELALRAIADLQPRLMMINYQDPDYVHWGNASHYTRGISIIDEGLNRLVNATDTDPFYRGRTIYVIVPDCGRDANPLMSMPFQHHFNSRSAHEIWALVFGNGIVRNRILDREVDQSAIGPTVAAAMGFQAHEAEGRALSEIFS